MTLAHPLPGYVITTPFNGYPGHRGADFAAPSGTPILAAHAGRVRFAGWDDRGGWMIYLTATDGNSETSYQHMVSSPSVRTGQQVSVGQVVGNVGTTGLSTGPHLHFEYWVNGLAWQGGTAVDPAPFIDTTPTPQPEYNTEEDEEMKLYGIYYKEGSTYYVAIMNTTSGLFQEYTTGDGSYNNKMADGFGTGNYIQMDKSHYNAWKRDMGKVRAGEA